MVNLMAPFGIAFFISMALCEKRKPALITGFGTLLGYISIYGNIKYLPSYCIVTITLVTLNYILKNSIKVKKLILFFAITCFNFSMINHLFHYL
jgi:stage II sporulation protein E